MDRTTRVCHYHNTSFAHTHTHLQHVHTHNTQKFYAGKLMKEKVELISNHTHYVNRQIDLFRVWWVYGERTALRMGERFVCKCECVCDFIFSGRPPSHRNIAACARIRAHHHHYLKIHGALQRQLALMRIAQHIAAQRVSTGILTCPSAAAAAAALAAGVAAAASASIVRHCADKHTCND